MAHSGCFQAAVLHISSLHGVKVCQLVKINKVKEEWLQKVIPGKILA